MFFSYLTILFEVLAHVFRALGVCAALLPIAGFLGFVALDRCDGLTAILGILAAGMIAIMAAAATCMELEQAAEKVSNFKFRRAIIKNM